MRAVTIRTFGGPEGLAVVDLPEPVAAAGEVLIEVARIGVGGVDAVIRRGTIGSGFPTGTVPGSEVAGEVVAVGDGVDRALVGARVWAFTGTAGGGYAERAVAAVDDLVVLPADLASEAAVTLGSAGPVAHFALERARATAGETVLIRGAGGSIGIAAVELAAALGAQVAVTTSSASRGERLRALGAVQVLDRSGKDPAGSPHAFDVIVDIIGGDGLGGFIDRLAPNGRLVAVGIVGGNPPADFGTALLRGFRRSISFGTLSLDTVPRDELVGVRSEQFAAAARGDLHAVVDDVLPLAEAAEAHRRMDAGEVFGRIVLVP